MEDVSGDVARNVTTLMTERSWKRPDLRKALEAVTRDEWPDHKLRILDQSKPGVRPYISVDEMLALCRAFNCSAYELLLPSTEPHISRDRSLALFGVEATFPIATWAKAAAERGDLRTRLQFHPDVAENVLELWFDMWRAAENLEAVEGADTSEYLQAVKDEKEAVENHTNAQSALISGLMKRGVSASDDEVAEWVEAYTIRHALRKKKYNIEYRGSMPIEGFAQPIQEAD